LKHPAERNIQTDHVAGFFHGGKKIFAFPMTWPERRHRLAVSVTLNVLPVSFEVFAL
jgi:hypothetical protein